MTPTLRMSEVYLSIQGEGPRVGSRTVFVRTGGCNLRCPGWPCDTPHAIDPEYRFEWKSTEPTDVVDRIMEVDGCKQLPRANVCFTGGEPFLQNKQALADTALLLDQAGYKTLEVFTNGTLRFPDWSLEEFRFILDWKLPGSGEDIERLDNSARGDNISRIGAIEGNAVKFTIASSEDLGAAVETFEKYQGLPGLEWYYGVVWGKQMPRALIETVLHHGYPWKYNHQLHNVIWDRNERGI